MLLILALGKGVSHLHSKSETSLDLSEILTQNEKKEVSLKRIYYIASFTINKVYYFIVCYALQQYETLLVFKLVSWFDF